MFDSIDAALLILGSLFFVALWVIEWYCGFKGKPTISERIQRLGAAAPIVVIWASFAAGYFLCHFFDHWGN